MRLILLLRPTQRHAFRPLFPAIHPTQAGLAPSATLERTQCCTQTMAVRPGTLNVRPAASQRACCAGA